MALATGLFAVHVLRSACVDCFSLYLTVGKFKNCIAISESARHGASVKKKDGGPKKFAVYVKDGDKIKKVTFGDPNMSIKRDSPERRKSFRARHNCDNPGPKTKARYWSCFQWRAGAKVDS